MVNITIEQLNYFFKLYECKNFSLASYELCISQSTLSKQIKALENELNTVLFYRNPRNILLTDAGEEFLIYAKKTMKEYNSILSSLKKYNNTTNTNLNIGAIPVITQYEITSAIADFKKLYPNIHINIVEDTSSNIFHKLINSEFNLGIVRDFNLSKDIFDKINLSDDELVLVVSKDHPLAQKSNVSLLDIKDEKFILLGPKSGIYERCMNEFNKHSLSPNIIAKLYKIESILGLVIENLGVTLLMRKVINSFNTSNLIIIPMKSPIKAKLTLVNQKDTTLSNSEYLFKNFIKEYFEK